MSRLTKSLERLVEGWDHFGLDTSQLLPGTSGDEVRDRIRASTGLEANDEVVEWFQFCDGGGTTHEHDVFGLVPTFELSNLLACEDAWLLFQEYQDEELEGLGVPPLDVATMPEFIDREIGFYPDASYFAVADSPLRTTLAVRLAPGVFPGPPVGSAVAIHNQGDVWVSIVWPSLADVIDEAAWLHLTDQVRRKPKPYLAPYDGPFELSDYAYEQRPRPLPEVQAFFSSGR